MPIQIKKARSILPRWQIDRAFLILFFLSYFFKANPRHPNHVLDIILSRFHLNHHPCGRNNGNLRLPGYQNNTMMIYFDYQAIPPYLLTNHSPCISTLDLQFSSQHKMIFFCTCAGNISFFRHTVFPQQYLQIYQK